MINNMVMRNLIVCFFLLFTFSSCNLKSKECVLVGKIDTELDGKFTLYPSGDYSSWEEIRKNSLTIEIVKGEFEQKIDNSVIFRSGTILLGGKSIKVDFFSEPGRIIFSGKPDSIKIGETPVTDEYFRLKKSLGFGNYAKIRYKRSLSAEEKTLKDKYIKKLWNEAKANPNNIPLTYFFSTLYFTADIETLDRVINVFSKEIQKTHYIAKLVRRRDIVKSLKVGSKAPEFNLSTNQGEEVYLGDYAGKYLLIDFWASWCAPCRMAIPEVKKVYEAFNNEGLEIINISVDTKEKDWLKAVKQENMPWKQLRDTKNIADLYDITFIPNIFLIDEEGRIVANKLHGEQIWKALEKVGFIR